MIQFTGELKKLHYHLMDTMFTVAKFTNIDNRQLDAQIMVVGNYQKPREGIADVIYR